MRARATDTYVRWRNRNTNHSELSCYHKYSRSGTTPYSSAREEQHQFCGREQVCSKKMGKLARFLFSQLNQHVQRKISCPEFILLHDAKLADVVCVGHLNLFFFSPGLRRYLTITALLFLSLLQQPGERNWNNSITILMCKYSSPCSVLATILMSANVSWLFDCTISMLITVLECHTEFYENLAVFCGVTFCMYYMH